MKTNDEIDEINRLLVAHSKNTVNLWIEGVSLLTYDWFENSRQKILDLKDKWQREAEIDTWKKVRKSYPKKNARMNDVSKLALADIDRIITELTQTQLNQQQPKETEE